MAVVVNPDGSITIGIIKKAEPKPVKAEAPAEVKTEPKKKATKKKQ